MRAEGNDLDRIRRFLQVQRRHRPAIRLASLPLSSPPQLREQSFYKLVPGLTSAVLRTDVDDEVILGLFTFPPGHLLVSVFVQQALEVGEVVQVGAWHALSACVGFSGTAFGIVLAAAAGGCLVIGQDAVVDVAGIGGLQGHAGALHHEPQLLLVQRLLPPRLRYFAVRTDDLILAFPETSKDYGKGTVSW